MYPRRGFGSFSPLHVMKEGLSVIGLKVFNPSDIDVAPRLLQATTLVSSEVGACCCFLALMPSFLPQKLGGREIS
jgi:hypothetical protein